MGLEHKVLAALGLGRLGAKAATVGGAFDMTVIAWSQNLTAGGRKDDNGLRPFEMVRVSQPFSERSILLTGLDFDHGGDIRSAKTCVSVQESPASPSLSLVTALQVESGRREAADWPCSLIVKIWRHACPRVAGR